MIKTLIARLRGEVPMSTLIKRGLRVGKNLKRMQGVIIDDSHPWLITIGEEVTLAPRVHILAHDASTKAHLGYTKTGCVMIEDRVFVGAGTVILPGVTIGHDAVIGANSTVTRDIPPATVAAGCPARVICTLEAYLAKERENMKEAPVYDESYTLRGNISEEKKRQQSEELKDGKIGYVI